MNNKNRMFSLLKTKNLSVYGLLVLFSIITLSLDKTVGLIEVGAVLIAFLFQLFFNANRNRKINEYIEELFMSSGSITKDFVINSVLPLAILKDDFSIIWYNNKFSETFFNEETEGNNIKEIMEDFPALVPKKETGEISVFAKYKDRTFNIMGSRVQAGDKDNKFYAMLYFIDVTDEMKYKDELERKELAYGKIVVDNYEESINGMSEAERAVLVADMDKHIFSWAAETDALIKKQSTGKYYIFFYKSFLDEYLKKGFEKLRDIKLTNKDSNIHLTLSIGIGYGGDTPAKNEEYSSASIDMALGRGGDQLVIKDNTGFSFYGGTSKEIEKRSKVRSRVVSQALCELIESKENVVVMGHGDPDMDVMGSALGIYRAVVSLNKNCYILNDTNTPGIQSVLDKIKDDPSYKDVLINKYQAENYLSDSGILVIVDTHRRALLPYPEMIDYASEFVIIDHHRKSADFIEGATLTYHEPYASSTAELVVEILQYMDEKTKLTKIECQALYAGILIDTKNFTFKTGVRTFEAASYLRRSGLDTAEAKELVKSDLDAYLLRNEIIESAVIYRKKTAICVYKKEIENSTIVAKAADELINIKGIETAFVIYKDEDFIRISARSLGAINVQLVMEKMGGGGHQLAAGTRIKDGDINEVTQELKSIIDEYIEE